MLFFRPKRTKDILWQIDMKIHLLIDGNALNGRYILGEAGADHQGIEFHLGAIVEGHIRIVLLY